MVPDLAVPSPCVNVCRMHEVTGWCEGCKRTLDEIAAWSTMDDFAKRAVWGQLRQRRIEWRRLKPETRSNAMVGGKGDPT